MTYSGQTSLIRFLEVLYELKLYKSQLLIRLDHHPFLRSGEEYLVTVP